MPNGIIDKYNNSEHFGIFNRDLTSDYLILQVDNQDYNAANTLNLDTKIGYTSPITTVNRDLYKLEATDKDRRSPVKRFVLNDLLRAGGNLSIYGITIDSKSCDRPLVAIEDYHYLSEPEDQERGYSLRVGVLQVEALKGGLGRDTNVYVGRSYILKALSNHVSGTDLDANEWIKWGVIDNYTIKSLINDIWEPNKSYFKGDIIAAIAPPETAKVVNYNQGCRIIFTHTHNIKDGGLDFYIPNY